jgi:hypothetical protein
VLFVQELLSLGLARRTGVGLMDAMLRHDASEGEERGEEEGQEEVQLLVQRSNGGAIAFYERLGFAVLGDADRQAFTPRVAVEQCMAVPRAELEARVAQLRDAASRLAYRTHANKGRFVLNDMRLFRETVEALQRARRERVGVAAPPAPPHVLPGDPRVRYTVATFAQ